MLGHRHPRNSGARRECEIVFTHAHRQFRRCSERAKEAFDKNSAGVYAQMAVVQDDESGYWQSIYRAATALSKWFRRHSRGRFFSGKEIESFHTPPIIKGSGAPFKGFDHAQYTRREGRAVPSAEDVISASKSVVEVELKRCNEMHKLRRLINDRRAKAKAAVRSCWTEEFFMHMGKPGQASDHSRCPVTAACRNKAVKKKYKWVPVPTLDHMQRSWDVIEECLTMPSTMALLDGIATGEATHHIESFHSWRCLFAPKQTHFKYWAMRNTMAKLHFNENLRRETLCTYETKVRRCANKVLTRTNKVAATFSWRERVVEEIMTGSC